MAEKDGRRPSREHAVEKRLLAGAEHLPRDRGDADLGY